MQHKESLQSARRPIVNWANSSWQFSFFYWTKALFRHMKDKMVLKLTKITSHSQNHNRRLDFFMFNLVCVGKTFVYLKKLN